MAHVRLTNVIMPEAFRLTLKGDSTVLAASLEDDPLYFYIERSVGRILILTVNIEEGDLPLRTAFPIMMTNALGWFAGSKGELRESMAAGATARIELAGASRTVEGKAAPSPSEIIIEVGEKTSVAKAQTAAAVLRSPTGSEFPLPAGEKTVTIGPLDQTGIWSLVTPTGDGKAAENGQPLQEIACNLHNAEESDLRTAQNFPSEESRLIAGLGGRPLWFYILVGVLLLFGTEWYLYQRRWMS